MTNDEDIFAEDYGKGKKEPEPKKESPNSDDKKSEKIIFGADDPKPKKEVKKEEKIPKKKAIKPTVGKAKVVGVSVIAVVIAVVAIMATGVVPIGEPEVFDTSQCKFGAVGGGFFEKARCMTENEFQTTQQDKEISISETGNSGEPIKVVPSASENVVETKKGIAGYFIVSSCCDWYGDFVDIGKVPKKIENAGNTKVNFICFNDEHLETHTYFGTFKNVLDPFLKVDVFINGIEVQSKTTNSGSALIVEGSCLGNES